MYSAQIARAPLAWKLAAYARDYAQLLKPRVTALVLVTTAGGFWLGLSSAAHCARLIPLLFGTALAAGGANALNQWMEREPDALMFRTRQRPLPSGRLEPEAARRFGLVLAVVGSLWLAWRVDWLAGALAAAAIISYVALYTPLKRTTTLCTLVGAIPGALPPLIGWAAARGSLAVDAWTLFSILFLWQLPHFLAIAVLFREDYARAGFQMLPVRDPGSAATSRQIVLYGLCLVPVSLLPTMLGLAGPWYFFGALVLGLLYLAAGIRAAMHRTLPAMRRLFLASILYLPLLFGLLVWDKRG